MVLNVHVSMCNVCIYIYIAYRSWALAWHANYPLSNGAETYDIPPQ